MPTAPLSGAPLSGVPLFGVPLFVTPDCTCCGACLLHCPERALRPAPGRPAVTDDCTGCGDCVEICPADALRLPGEPGWHAAPGTREGAR